MFSPFFVSCACRYCDHLTNQIAFSYSLYRVAILVMARHRGEEWSAHCIRKCRPKQLVRGPALVLRATEAYCLGLVVLACILRNSIASSDEGRHYKR